MSTEQEVSEIDRTPAIALDSSDSSIRAKCGFCQQGFIKDHPLEGGKLYSVQTSEGEVYVHYFCILFCSKAKQVGTDSEGLFGFYGSEILKQLQEKSKKICKYCQKGGASAGCCRKHCQVTTHFTCGMKVGATFQFYENMWVHCRAHRQRQIQGKFPVAPDRDCVICYEEVGQDTPEYQSLQVPCCGRYFHRDCIQRYAVSSGREHFKCSNCNDRTKIMKELERMGIYFPVKDADWEDKTFSGFYNFQDMYQQKRSCDVVFCLVSDREFSQENTDTEIVLCEACGINGSHIKCSSLSIQDSSFTCGDCGGDTEILCRSTISTAGDTSLQSDISLPSDLSTSGDSTLLSDLSTSGDSTVLADLSTSGDSTVLSDLSTSGDSSILADLSTSSLDTSDSLPDVDEFLRKYQKSSSTSVTDSDPEKEISVTDSDVEDAERPQPEKSVGDFFKLAQDFSNVLDEVKRKEAESNTVLDDTPEKEDDQESKSSHAIVRFLADSHQRATDNHQRPRETFAKSSFLKVRKDIFINGKPTIVENIFSEEEEITSHLRGESDACQGPVFVVPEKKRKFAALLIKKQKPPVKNVKFLKQFYQILAPEDFKPAVEVKEDPVITLDETVDPQGSDDINVSIPETPLNKIQSKVAIVPSPSLDSVKSLTMEKSSASRSPRTISPVSSTVKTVKTYRPGPRSRTKPHLPPVKLTESLPVHTESLPPVQSLKSPVQSQSPVQSPVQYKPGPKSRKQFLVVGVDAEKNECSGTVSPKRKSEDIASPNKKRKVEADESIEDIEKFLEETETIMEVSPTPANKEALDRRRAKRPFKCPVCEGFFGSRLVLQHHLAKIHFWQRILQLPREAPSVQGLFWVCPEVPCNYVHRVKDQVAGHLAKDHGVVFRIAKSLFPSFELPQPAVFTIDDEEEKSVNNNPSIPGKSHATVNSLYPVKL